MQVNEGEFEELMGKAIDNVPEPYRSRLNNIAFILEDDPTPEQRAKQRLAPWQTLFGLYEGVPLPARGGTIKLLPDKITIFRNPLLTASRDLAQLKENIGHTVWHEVAHYFGLDHAMIEKLDRKDSLGI